MKKRAIGKKLLKILLWTVSVLLVLVAAVILVTYFLVIPKIDKALLNDGAEIAAIVEESIPEEVLPEIAELAEEIIPPSPEPTATATPTPKPTTKPSSAKSKPKPTATPAPTATPDDSSSAYDRISQAASKKEMIDGLRIIGKLDIKYVSSLLSGGLTAAEKKELKTYVYSKLSKSDVSKALQLYRKYKGYL